MTKGKTPAPRTTVETIEAARRMVRPVAELLLDKISCPTAVLLLKQAFIEAAERRIRSQDPSEKSRVTRSELAFLTGLDARAIGKITDNDQVIAPDGAARGEPYRSPVTDLLGMWSSHADWQDPDTGRPRVLPAYGQGLTFQTLVNRSVGKSISYSVVMDQLLKSGNIRRTEQQALELVIPFERLPAPDQPATDEMSIDQLCCLGRNIVHKQFEPTQSPEYHWPRGLFWNRRIPATALPAIRKEMKALVEQHGREIDTAIEHYADTDEHPEHTTVGVGWYYWENPDPSLSAER